MIGLISICFFLTSIWSCASAQQLRHVSETNVENVLAGTRWKSQGVPFEHADTKSYSFNSFDESNFNDRWGHFISFDSATFTSSYSAQCGNDCFTSVRGLYWFTSELQIKVKVIEILRRGFCEKETETLNKEYGYYNLTPRENGWTLTKVSEKE